MIALNLSEIEFRVRTEEKWLRFHRLQDFFSFCVLYFNLLLLPASCIYFLKLLGSYFILFLKLLIFLQNLVHFVLQDCDLRVSLLYDSLESASCFFILLDLLLQLCIFLLRFLDIFFFLPHHSLILLSILLFVLQSLFQAMHFFL